MQTVKNIIFDLGGVLLDVDYSKTEKAFIDAGIVDFAEFYSQNHASHLFESLETGKISPREFFIEFRSATNCELKDQEIKTAWNALLGRFFLDRLEWVSQLKSRYGVYLFSNTNQIHKETFQQIFLEQTGNTRFEDYFDGAFYSHEIGVRKPHPAAYLKVLNLAGLNAEETVFIDDTKRNIEGAKEAGLHTLYLLPHQPVDGLF